MKVLFAGESWFIYSVHQKGFDSFTTGEYEEGRKWLESALKNDGIEVDYIPNHLASVDFPTSLEELKKYNAVILSDIGSNTLLIHPDTFKKCLKTPNRLKLLKGYVQAGGGLIMFGGYLSFQGIEGKAHYKGTPIEELLPVNMVEGDDRVEVPEGFIPRIVNPNHPIVKGVPTEWPAFLSYNKLKAKPSATIIADHGDDAILTAWEYGAGRSIAFAMDCAPHGAPYEFLEWEYYGRIWSQAIRWLAKEI
ncbi:MAG: hypothetical protein PWP04_684 [Candidatus Atribacteria bacterium]|nr:hypothetical protein [Candidatus Atribacteria bacterium]